jgi:hypothetical protein
VSRMITEVVWSIRIRITLKFGEWWSCGSEPFNREPRLWMALRFPCTAITEVKTECDIDSVRETCRHF